MDAIIKWISEQLAEHSSRRRFFSTMEKAVLGTAAIITGQGFSACSSNSAQSASTQPVKSQTDYCCDPTTTRCASSVCPSGSSIQYTWLCHTLDGGTHACNDCSDDSGAYICTYII